MNPPDHPVPVSPVPIVRYQPKAQRCSMLALLWILPTTGAVFILANGGGPARSAASLGQFLEQVRFEQWIAAGLIVAHLGLVIMARHYRRVEPFREEPVESPLASSDDDAGGLDSTNGMKDH